MYRYIKASSEIAVLSKKLGNYVEDYLLKHELGQYINWYKSQYGDEVTASVKYARIKTYSNPEIDEDAYIEFSIHLKLVPTPHTLLDGGDFSSGVIEGATMIYDVEYVPYTGKLYAGSLYGNKFPVMRSKFINSIGERAFTEEGMESVNNFYQRNNLIKFNKTLDNVDFRSILNEALNMLGLGYLILPDKFDDDLQRQLDYFCYKISGYAHANSIKSIEHIDAVYYGGKLWDEMTRRDIRVSESDVEFEFTPPVVDVSKFTAPVSQYVKEWNTEVVPQIEQYIDSIVEEYKKKYGKDYNFSEKKDGMIITLYTDSDKYFKVVSKPIKAFYNKAVQNVLIKCFNAIH